MSLWDLLTVISGAAAFGTAMSVARKAGAFGSWISAVVGLCVGIGCVCGIRMMGAYSFRRIKEKCLASRQESAYRLLYFVAFAWVILSGFLGFWITKWINIIVQ